MAFSGHRRSLQLRSPVNDTYHSPPEVDRRVSSTDDRTRRRSRRTDGYTVPPNATTDPNRDERSQPLVDNKGNAPTKSLWVGNTPQGIEERSVRSAFERFGRISHVRLPKNQRYVFVNYEDVRDATDAWRACHDEDVFYCDLRLNIRFTSSESQAKEAKRVESRRKSSVDTLPSASDTLRPAAAPWTDATAKSQEWPNGRPPAGPRATSSDHWSRACDMSPPVRRDTYRPSVPDSRISRSHLDTTSGQRHDKNQPSGDYFTYDAERNRPRRPSLLYASSLTSSDASLYVGDSSKHVENATDSLFSDLQRSETSDMACGQTKQSREAPGMTKFVESPSSQSSDCCSNNSITDFPPSAAQSMSEHANILMASPLTMREPTLSDVALDSPDPRLRNMTKNSTHPMLTKLLDEGKNVNGTTSQTQSPLSRVRKSMERADSVNGRATSVVSEATTSSRSSLTRRKKCAGCNTPESSLMPLTLCSTCPRKFHSGCGDPYPSMCTDKAQFTCGKCLKKQKTTLSASYINGSKDLEPELTHTRDVITHGDTELLSATNDLQGNVAMMADPDLHQINRDLQLPEEDSYSPTLPPETALELGPDHETSAHGNREDEVPLWQTTTNGQHDTHTTNLNRDSELYFVSMLVTVRYKTHVTCPYWLHNDCKRSEKDCMFAHRDTGLYTPKILKSAGRWTCYRYMSSVGCPSDVRSCPFSHSDTGYYVGVDGKACKKHLTCHWWRKNGQCRKAEDRCLYSHRDTGFYAEDPSIRPIPDHRLDDAPAPVSDAAHQVNPLDLPVLNEAYSAVRIEEASSAEPKSIAKTTSSGLDPRTAQRNSMAQKSAASDALKSDLANQARPEPSARISSELASTIATASAASSDLGPDLASKSTINVKRCKFCKKNVFSGDVCQRCKRRGELNDLLDDDRALLTLLDLETTYDAEKGKKASETETGAEAAIAPAEPMDSILEHELPSPETHEIVQQPVRRPKRGLSEKDMFIANKRSKPNTVTPVARSFVAHIDSASAVAANTINGPELRGQKSLTEKVKDGSLGGIAQATNESDEGSDEEPLAVAAAKGALGTRASGQKSHQDPVALGNKNLPDGVMRSNSVPLVIGPPQRSITAEHERATKAANIIAEEDRQRRRSRRLGTSAAAEQRDNSDEGGNAIADVSVVANEAESVPPSAHFSATRFDTVVESDKRPCKDCSTTQIYCVHRKFVHPMMEQDQLQSSTTGVTASTVCNACRARHKRCLHGPDQNADGKKCLQWLIERKQRNSTQCDRRTRIEREIIETAATLFEYGYLPDSETISRSTTSAEEVFDKVSEVEGDEYDATEPTEDSEDEIEDSAGPERVILPSSPNQVSPQARTLRDTPSIQLESPKQSTTEPQSARVPRIKLFVGQQPEELAPGRKSYQQVTDELKAKGVVFESESEGSDDEPIPSFYDRRPPPAAPSGPSDPLLYKPKKMISTDLFEVISQSKKNTRSTAPVITKGEGLKGRVEVGAGGKISHKSGSRLVQQRAMVRNLERHGNVHYEVDRQRPESRVTAWVENRVPGPSTEKDRFGSPVVEVKEQTMTFKEFLVGLGAGPIEPCLIGSGSLATRTLAFRETNKTERGLGMFARKKRHSEAAAWPVRDS